MKKSLINENKTDFTIVIIGIVSHFKESQIIWNINNFAGMNFSKISDFEKKLKEDLQLFSMYHFLNDSDSFFLVSNKNSDTLLIPKYKSFDYFLVFSGKNRILAERIVNKISFSEIINAAYILPEDKLLRKTFIRFFEE